MKLNDAEFLDDLERRVEANDWTERECRRLAFMSGRKNTAGTYHANWVKNITAGTGLRLLQIHCTRDWIVSKIVARLTK